MTEELKVTANIDEIETTDLFLLLKKLRPLYFVVNTVYWAINIALVYCLFKYGITAMKEYYRSYLHQTNVMNQSNIGFYAFLGAWSIAVKFYYDLKQMQFKTKYSDHKLYFNALSGKIKKDE